jgi:hypothetical protein
VKRTPAVPLYGKRAVEYLRSTSYIRTESRSAVVEVAGIYLSGGDLASTGMRKLRTAYRGLRVHVKEAVNNQVPTTTTHWLLNLT